jgi:hypothetical protein
MDRRDEIWRLSAIVAKPVYRSDAHARLMEAMLFDSIRCVDYRGSIPRFITIAHEAQDWVFNGGDDGPFGLSVAAQCSGSKSAAHVLASGQCWRTVAVTMSGSVSSSASERRCRKTVMVFARELGTGDNRFRKTFPLLNFF